jgi:hypothetical protein
VPQQNDDPTVPPVKILRRRLSGVYRSDGLSGPTRRYALIVAMLIGLASLPTLVVITAGSNELDKGATGPLDVPFLPLPGTGPVVPPSATATTPPRAKAQRQGSKPTPPRYDRSKRTRPGSGHPSPPGKKATQPPAKLGKKATQPSSRRAAQPPARKAETAHRRDPDQPARPRQPVCRKWATSEQNRLRQVVRELLHRRSRDRSVSHREPAVTERPHNARTNRTSGRTHNSHRHRAEARPDNARRANHAPHDRRRPHHDRHHHGHGSR